MAYFSIRICAEASQILRIQIPLRDLYSCADAELEVRRARLSVKRFGMEEKMEKEMRQARPEDAGPAEKQDRPERPKVSICIPAYNNAAEVRRLLLSIAEQTMQDVEIILTDDSTNGGIEALVEEIRGGKSADARPAPWTAPCMSRLRYVHNEKPLGHIFNWNKALSLAQGEYIKIMFSDDWLRRETAWKS